LTTTLRRECLESHQVFRLAFSAAGRTKAVRLARLSLTAFQKKSCQVKILTLHPTKVTTVFYSLLKKEVLKEE